MLDADLQNAIRSPLSNQSGENLPPIFAVYMFKCVEGNKIYVGSSNDVKGRKRSHLYMLRHNRHYNAHMQWAFNKYGESAFEFHILESCSKTTRKDVEQRWINTLKVANPDFGFNGTANVAYVPDSPKQYQKGKPHSLATKQLLSERAANNGNRLTESVVVAILQNAYEGVRVKDIAKYYNITPTVVTKYTTGKALYGRLVAEKYSLPFKSYTKRRRLSNVGLDQ